jgi:hypothetical protein
MCPSFHRVQLGDLHGKRIVSERVFAALKVKGNKLRIGHVCYPEMRVTAAPLSPCRACWNDAGQPPVTR